MPAPRSPRPARPRSTSGQEVRWPGGTARFEIDWQVKHRLLNGLDDIAATLAEDSEAIDAYEHDRQRSGPVTTAL